MTWGEVYRLTLVLARDPSTAVGAALAGWSHPMTREALVLADVYDLQHASKAKRRPKPYPRPWAADKDRSHRGTGRYTIRQLAAVLTATRAHPPEEESP